MSLPFKPRYLWVDLEMSGLDPLKNRIIEFACILTDEKLMWQHEGPHIVIHCDEDHLKTMDEWNTTYRQSYVGIIPSRGCGFRASKVQLRLVRPRPRFWSTSRVWGSRRGS
jgi:oligoribonuclease (3'-5' exoribonuclease)